MVILIGTPIHSGLQFRTITIQDFTLVQVGQSLLLAYHLSTTLIGITHITLICMCIYMRTITVITQDTPHGHGGFHAAVNINVNKNINLKKNNKRDLPGNRQTTNTKIDKKKMDNKDFNRFKANDSHKGNWTKAKNKNTLSRGKRN